MMKLTVAFGNFANMQKVYNGHRANASGVPGTAVVA